MMTNLFSCNKDSSSTDATHKQTNNSTTEAPTTTPSDQQVEAELPGYLKNPDLTKYNLRKYIYPFWEGNTCFAEASFVRENEDGIVEPLGMLYPISEIVSVRSADLKTLYVEGKDYTITEDGKINVLRDGKIPVLAYDKYCFELTQAEHDANKLSTKLPIANKPGWGYIRAEVNDGSGGMAKWTLAVTYRHEPGKSISIPKDKSASFAKLLAKVEAKEDIKVVSLGDSITDKWSATGTAANIAPFCPAYNEMICAYIKTLTKSDVIHKNLAISGSTSESGGVARISDAIAEDPDLVIIAFGMNDGCWMPPDAYIANINKMVADIQAACPDVCIVVVGTCLPNVEFAWNPGGPSAMVYHEAYRPYLINAEKSWTNAAFADVTIAHKEMMKFKTYQDTSGSNSNHPNDYVHRLYAQVIIQTIFGEIT